MQNSHNKRNYFEPMIIQLLCIPSSSRGLKRMILDVEQVEDLTHQLFSR